MIKLEQVSTDRYLKYINFLAFRNEIYKELYDLFIKYNIKNYQEIKDLLESKKEELDIWFNYLRCELSEVEKRMEEYNILGFEPEIFTFDNYANSSVDKETLKITDNSNMGSVLLYTFPFFKGGARMCQLKNMNIADLKYLSGHVNDCKFQNALEYKRNFGPEVVSRVVDRVKFYEEQVLRIANETTERGINLFTVNKKEKDEIVRANLDLMVQYIVDCADECIWGVMSDTQKKRFLRAARAVYGEHILKDREMLIDAISNYTTLSELNSDVVKTKTLDRFIVRKM